ncbi:MAG: type 1 glutamine amidotransferase domain-containing protein [Thermoproteota archaeon]
MPKVLIMVEDGVEDVEFIYPYYRFQEAGYEVEVVAPDAGETYKGKHGVPFKSDLSPEEVDVDEYDALVIPGGRAPDRMRIDHGLVKIVEEADGKEKVIAAVCHGPQMLIEAGVMKGRKATCWKSVITDLKNAGANYVNAPVVVDENLVTSRFPGDLPRFCQETLKILSKR